ncbi:GIY-YIG nuclease family protein [Synechococcus sp. CS-1324]|uniref:GIY-YIG nuclease family protein n=1 Tax=Synechococcus sp. CS-1324 TaxID=2847980 RepID=UPI00223C13F8|nr:GIY-YIG nuclease family protein [Synechococcus sp. CS-1324]MCT0230033.1 GIY-YIG nuclease family protein [Synechococcus sp. CS-1324]
MTPDPEISTRKKNAVAKKIMKYVAYSHDSFLLDSKQEPSRAYSILIFLIHLPVPEWFSAGHDAKKRAIEEISNYLLQLGITEDDIGEKSIFEEKWKATKKKRIRLSTKLFNDKLRLELGLGEDSDPQLAKVLSEAVARAKVRRRNYVYLKSWTLADGTKWYKIGRTNNLERRSVEQNVLPVAAITLGYLETSGVEEAAEIESAILSILDEYRIRGASNKELFHLTGPQLNAMLSVMSQSIICKNS